MSDSNEEMASEDIDKSFQSPEADSVNWMSCLEFLQDQHRNVEVKETEWLIKEQQLEAKIDMFESTIKSQENINKDLVMRIKMLEFALRQERYSHPLPHFQT